MARRLISPALVLGLVGLALLPLLAVYVEPLAAAAGRGAFEAAWARPFQWELAGRSLALAALASLLAVAIGVPVGLAPVLRAGPGRTAWLALALLPLALPPYLTAIAWIGLFGDHGIVRELARRVIGGAADGLTIYSLPGCAWVQALALWPCVALLVRAARSSIDPAVEDAARLHLPPLRALVRVILPAIRRELLVGAGLVFVLSLADFAVPSVLQVNVYALEVFTRFEQSYDHVASAAMSLPILAAVALLLFVERRALSGKVEFPSAAAREGSRPGPAWWAVGVAVALSIGLPVLQLLFDAGGGSSYLHALQVARRPVVNTLLLGAAGTLVVGGAGLLVALLVRFRCARAEGAISFALLFSFALPAALVGIGLVRVWNRPGPAGLVYGSPAILLLAYFSRTLVVPYRVLSVGLAGAELGDGLAAARVHGLARAVTLRRVILPALGEHLRIALLVLYVLVIGELGASVLVQPPGWDTLPIRLFQLIHYGYAREVAALTVILLGIVLLPAAAAWGWSAWRTERAPQEAQRA